MRVRQCHGREGPSCVRLVFGDAIGDPALFPKKAWTSICKKAGITDLQFTTCGTSPDRGSSKSAGQLTSSSKCSGTLN